MEKTLTISIAAYNVENYIRQTLDSLIDENFIDDLEILVIDDGGTDHTLEIAQEYAERYPQSVFPIHKDNGGYGSTINTGIELATGKYFKQLDGDDWYQTKNIKELLDIMKKVSVDCVLTDYLVYREAFEKFVYKDQYEYMDEGEYAFDQSGIKDRFSMYTSAFRTALLKEMSNRLSEHCFYTDIEYSALPLPYIETIFVLHKEIYIYRTGEDGQSVSVTGIEKHYKEHETVFWRLLDIYKTINTEKETNRKIFRLLLEKRMKEHYEFLCVLPDSNTAKHEIKEFTENAQSKCPDLLDCITEHSGRYNAMVKWPILAYPLYRNRVVKQWRQAGRL